MNMTSAENASIHSYEETPSIALDQWRLVCDEVMGGQSCGELDLVLHDKRRCNQLSGDVSTANNGGFIKIAHDLDREEKFAASDATGIRLTVKGNNEQYNVHLQTSDLWLPWQSYRHSFHAAQDWQTLELPFSDFQPCNVDIAFNPKKLSRISLVAIGRNFHADLYVNDVSYF